MIGMGLKERLAQDECKVEFAHCIELDGADKEVAVDAGYFEGGIEDVVKGLQKVVVEDEVGLVVDGVRVAVALIEDQAVRSLGGVDVNYFL